MPVSHSQHGRTGVSGARKPSFGAKVVLLGKEAVGKSCIGTRLVHGKWDETPPESTIGAAYLSKSIECTDATIRFEIWDTAGQERFRSFAPMYYRNAAAAVVVFDITSMASFERSKSWVDEMRKQQSQETVICLAANKADLGETLREVSQQEASSFARSQGLLYFETSAKSGLNVEAMFQALAARVPRTKAISEGEGAVDLSKSSTEKSGKRGCC